MLRRLITRDRLDRGIWNSADEEGRTNILRGCFWFGFTNLIMGFGMLFLVNYLTVLAQKAPFIVEIPCGEKTGNVEQIGHLTGCRFEEDILGGFRIDNLTFTSKQRGELIKRLRTEEVWSFLGNVSHGSLKQWKSTGFVMNRYEPGISPAHSMVHNQGVVIRTSWALIILLSFCSSVAAACMFFFPNGSTGRNFPSGSVIMRSVVIAVLAAVSDLLMFALYWLQGTQGLCIAIIIIAGLLYVGCSDELSSHIPFPDFSSRTANQPQEDSPLIAHAPQENTGVRQTYDGMEPGPTHQLDYDSPSKSDLALVVGIGLLMGLTSLWVFIGLAFLMPNGIRFE